MNVARTPAIDKMGSAGDASLAEIVGAACL